MTDPPPDRSITGRADTAGMVISQAEALTSHTVLGLERGDYWEEVAGQLAEAERPTARAYGPT